MKVALVHDYLKEYGGAERVLEALHEIWPQAPVFTAYYDLDLLGPHKARIKNWKIKSSWLQNIPFVRKLISPFRIFAPMIFEGFDLKEFDLVISSCNTYFSKAVITKPGSLHISYIHTPPRYLYGYTTSFNYKKHSLTKIGGELINHILRIYDFETSQRPDILVANSKNVAERIKKFYRREAVVIYPPVLLPRHPERSEGSYKEYFLSLGRLVKGKGVEVVVETCTMLNLPLKVVGTGPELEDLKKRAGKSIEFLGEVIDEELPALYSQAKALICASEDEDFGITAVEAIASGTPVIAVRAGGFLETVVEGKTGEFFDQASSDSLIKVLKLFNPSKYQQKEYIIQAKKFSKDRFKKEIIELVKRELITDKI